MGMDFNTKLELTLEALTPAQFRHLAHRRRRNRLAEPQPMVPMVPVAPPAEQTKQASKAITGLPKQVRSQYELLKNDIENNQVKSSK
jgi:hypothetical protein